MQHNEQSMLGVSVCDAGQQPPQMRRSKRDHIPFLRALFCCQNVNLTMLLLLARTSGDKDKQETDTGGDKDRHGRQTQRTGAVGRYS